jgi:hypothetical protein
MLGIARQSFFFFSSHAFSAACCGGGSSFPTVITGDNQSILSFSSSTSSVIGDVDPDGVSTFRRTENKESKNTFTLICKLKSFSCTSNTCK